MAAIGQDAIATGKIELDEHLDEKHTQSLGAEAPTNGPLSHFAHLTPGQAFRTFKHNVFICILVLFITANDGYQLTIPGNLIANTGFIKQFATTTNAAGNPALAASVVSAWAGFYSLGYILSLLISPFPNDWFGRKAGMMGIGGSCIIATLISMFATSWPVWGVAKILNGVAVGFAQATLTAYVSEIAPPQIRGGLLGVYSLFFAIGQFTASICLYIVQRTDALNWRRAIYSEWVYTGIFILSWLYIPESPAWYIRKGKNEQAKRILQRINGHVAGYDVEHEFNVMKHDIDEGMRVAASYGKVNWTSIYRGINRRRTWVSFFPLALQQLIGIPVVFGYTSVFFQAAGLTNPFIGTVIVQITLLAFISFSFFIVDKVGRRPLYLICCTIMILALLSIGITASIPAASSATTYVTVALLCIWVAAYASSAGPLGYVYLAESSTPALRAKSTGHAAAFTGIFGLIFSYSSPYMILSTGGGAGWGLKTGYFYAGTATVAVVLFYFTIPETKGRSFAALNELFERRIPARKFKTTSASMEEAYQPTLHA